MHEPVEQVLSDSIPFHLRSVAVVGDACNIAMWMRISYPAQVHTYVHCTYMHLQHVSTDPPVLSLRRDNIASTIAANNDIPIFILDRVELNRPTAITLYH